MHWVPPEPSREELLEEAKKRPVDYYRSWGRIDCEIKENERYSVTSEIDLDDRKGLAIALIDFQTKEKVWVNCYDLLDPIMIYDKKKDEFLHPAPSAAIIYGYYDIKQWGFENSVEVKCNLMLWEKVLSTKPYITQEELLLYFKQMIGNEYVYFKFNKYSGVRPGYLKYCSREDIEEDLGNSRLKNYMKDISIINIYKGEKI